jgi:PIF1-like helicase
MLQDLRDKPKKFFRDVPVVFSSDFTQIPPVVSKGRRVEQVQASLRSDLTFSSIKTLSLTQNIRLGIAITDQQYAE